MFFRQCWCLSEQFFTRCPSKINHIVNTTEVLGRRLAWNLATDGIFLPKSLTRIIALSLDSKASKSNHCCALCVQCVGFLYQYNTSMFWRSYMSVHHIWGDLTLASSAISLKMAWKLWNIMLYIYIYIYILMQRKFFII